jgi:hypothetical protein
VSSHPDLDLLKRHVLRKVAEALWSESFLCGRTPACVALRPFCWIFPAINASIGLLVQVFMRFVGGTLLTISLMWLCSIRHKPNYDRLDTVLHDVLKIVCHF